MLIESARIARGAISPLSELKEEEHSAVILPGGFGAAKNLYVILILSTILLIPYIGKSKVFGNL